MLRRHILATAAASFAAPAIVSRASLGQNLRKVKMGSAFTTTTNAAFLMPALLKPEGIDLELVMFPSLVQRMQAVASGDVDIGNGGLSATMQVATKGFPMQVLANGCDGGWMVLAQPSIGSFKDLVGKKIAVQKGANSHYLLVKALQSAKLSPSQVTITFLKPSDARVAFERGESSRAYVIGCLWSGKDQPPKGAPNDKDNIRMIKSRSGHIVTLDDTKGAEKIIIADKSDVHRSRVQNPLIETFDIHDRVNYAVTKSRIEMKPEGHTIELTLEIDTAEATVMEYFEIFLSRMVMCRKSADMLGYKFSLNVNGTYLE